MPENNIDTPHSTDEPNAPGGRACASNVSDGGELESKIFRIFVSSTFSDTRPERNHLQKKIFPELKNLCESNGYRFQAVDLRWGVTSESAYDQQTMRICLEEIKRSQKISPRPNFIILLGDRYGWLPLPYEIPQTDFDAAKDHLENKLKLSPGNVDLIEIKSLLEKWYMLDENADPAAYCLIPRDPKINGDMSDEAREAARKREEAEWNHAETVLHSFFSEACDKINISEPTRLKFKLSATAQEIAAGALSESTDQRHVFAFFRKIEGLPEKGPAQDYKGYIDLDKNGEVDTDMSGLLNDLKDDLRKTIPGNIFKYETKWLGKKEPASDDEIPITTDHVEKFGEDVKASLTNTILDRIASDKEIGALKREIRSHDKFGAERSRIFIGRVELLRRLGDYIKKKVAGDHSPLMLWGISGCGKTALLAKAIDELRKESLPRHANDADANGEARPASPEAPVIVSRFIGATADSADIRSMLKSICKEIRQKLDIAFEKEITDDMRHLPDIFKELLGRVPSDKTLVIFIDALDQMLEPENAHNVSSWLPAEIPAGVRIVVSTLKGCGCYESLVNSIPAGNIVEITGMSPDEGKEYLDTWLSAKKRGLKGAGQYDRVLDAYKACPYPLYFKLLLEEAALWRSFDSVARARIGADYESIIGVLFDRLSRAHGGELVGRSLGYLAAAKNGLTDDEMIDILTHDDEFYDHFNKISFWKLKKGDSIKEREKVPVVIWSKLYFDLAPYLTEKTADGTSLLNFYHRQLREVTKKFFLAGKNKLSRHETLAGYFQNQTLYIENVADDNKKCLPNFRKCSELPFQLRKARMFEKLDNTLTDLYFVDAAAKAGRAYELVDEYEITGIGRFRHGPPLVTAFEHNKKYGFKCKFCNAWNNIDKSSLNSIISCSRCNSKLKMNPFTVKSEWQEKCPDEDMVELIKASNRKENEQYHYSTAISEFADFIRANVHIFSKKPSSVIQKAINEPDHLPQTVQAIGAIGKDKYLKWMNKPAVKSSCLATFSVGPGSVTACALSPDGSVLASACYETIKLWDVRSGREIKTLGKHSNIVTSCAFSSDGSILFSVSSYNESIISWDIKKCCMIQSRTFNYFMSASNLSYEPVKVCAISPDGGIIVTASNDFKLFILYVNDFYKEPKILAGHKGKVTCCSISPDGSKLVSSSEDKTIKIWDLNNLTLEPVTLFEHSAAVTSCAISPDGLKLISSSADQTLRIWDLKNHDNNSLILAGHGNRITDCAFSPSGSMVLSASTDKTIKIWPISNCYKIAGSLGGLVQNKKLGIWHVDITPLTIKENSDYVSSCFFSPDELHIYSVSGDTVKVWDIESVINSAASREHDVSSDKIFLSVFRSFPAIDVPCIVFRNMYFGISSDGNTIITPGINNDLMIWNENSWKNEKWVPAIISGHKAIINCCAVSYNGKFIVTASKDKTLKIWDVHDIGKDPVTLVGHDDAVTFCAISNDCSTIVSASADKTLKIWNIKDLNKEPITLVGHNDAVIFCAISPDGSFIISTSDDKTIKVWETQNLNKGPRTLYGHSDTVTSCAISPDASTLVSASADRTIKIWNAVSGDLVHEIDILEYHPFVSISRDGQFIVVGGGGKTVQIFCSVNFEICPKRLILTALTDENDNSCSFGCLRCRKWSVITDRSSDASIVCPQCGYKAVLNSFFPCGRGNPVENNWEKFNALYFNIRQSVNVYQISSESRFSNYFNFLTYFVFQACVLYFLKNSVLINALLIYGTLFSFVCISNLAVESFKPGFALDERGIEKPYFCEMNRSNFYFSMLNSIIFILLALFFSNMMTYEILIFIYYFIGIVFSVNSILFGLKITDKPSPIDYINY